ncbi:NLR family CARD domain-containing protein 3-like [Hoplias malabaricus]|uniref:NLR family CARD domain-containing protein 3-like n=1 Tax=Hoplias malabaricus TaxID=27720 RepID=UPI0034621BE0
MKERRTTSTMSDHKLEDSSFEAHSSFHLKRPSSLVPSGVSLKSDRSMKMPINYSGECVQLERSSSPVPSGVSLKSDRSMKMPINYSGVSLPQEENFHSERPSSPVPSGVSLKSDRSMKMPINYSGESLPQEECVQLDKSSSSVPSGVSLKSDRSMKMPINYSGTSLPIDESCREHLWISGPKDFTMNDVLSITVNSGEAPFDSDALRKDNTTLRMIFREKYQHLFEGTTHPGNPVLLNNIYTELYITESRMEAHCSHHEASHIKATQKTSEISKLINYNDIFSPSPEQDKPIKIVLSKGVAGIGKSVTVQKFILDWAEGEANQDVHFILPVPFRELNIMRDLTYSLNDLHQHFSMKGIDASSLQHSNHSLIIIFDGLDECRLPLDFENNEINRDVTKATSVDVLLTNLIKGNLLPSAQIWITSRPAACGRIPTKCVDRVTEVRGFNDPQKEKYFRKRINDQSLANGIITHLKSLRSLYIMCHIPVFCWIAATVLERMVVDCGWENMPRSLTQLYTHFLITQINAKKAKYSDNKAVDREMIFKLGKLAFEQLEKGNLIFYEEDLTECGIDVREASVYSGVFTQIFREEFGLFQRKVFSFVHLSIQEHLAALYVFLTFHNHNQNVLSCKQASDSDENVTMLDVLKTAVDKASDSESGHLDLFLRFLMGFSLESNQNLLKELLIQKRSNPSDIKETTDYLKTQIKMSHCPYMFLKCFHCLNELNDCSLLDEIQTFLRHKNQNEGQNLSPELWSALVFMIVTSDEKMDVFELSKYGKSDDVLLYLIAVFKLYRTARFSNCNITSRGCAALAAALPIMSATRELDLSLNNIQDTGVQLLCTGIPGDTVEQKLLNCSITAEDSASDGKKEKSTEKLLHRFMDRLHQKHGINEFFGLKGTECNIEILRLKHCGVTSVGCDFLALALNSNNSNLKELDLTQNYIGDSGVKVICEALKDTSCKLVTLKLSECGITEQSCAALASVFSFESLFLRELDLSMNDINDSGAKLLSVGLGNPHCKLQKLLLYKCNITEAGNSDLAEALQSNPSL